MFLNMDQLQKQLDNNEFQEIGSMASFKVLETQFQMFIKSKIYLNDEYIVMTRNYFLEYTRLDIPEFRDTLIQNMDYVKKSIEKRALHKMEYDSRVNERLMQTTEEKVDSSKALDASLVIIESNGTESQKQDTSSRSGNDAHVNDADIRPIYNEEPMAEVQTTDDNVSATGQQHTEQPEFNNEGKVDQNAEQCHEICPLPAKLTDDKTTELSNQSLESENVCLKKTVAQCQQDFAKLEAHCINLELQLQMENNVLKSGQQSQFFKEKGNESQLKMTSIWVPTGKIFTSSITKVDSEPPNGSKEDITNQCESEQALDVSAGTLLSTDLAAQRQMVSAENNTLGPAPFLNVQKTFDRSRSSLGLHGDDVCSHQFRPCSLSNDFCQTLFRTRNHDHSNEPSSSKLVPKVVPLAFKTATSRQELELLFHHIAMLRTTGTGPNWMFDLDFLTNSMNYVPVSVENQVNMDADKDVQDSEDAADKEEQHQMQENEKVLQDELEMMVTQELAAKAMNDVSRQAFEEEMRRIASQKKAAQATSTNQLSTDRLSVSTDRQIVSTDRSFVSTDRSNTPSVSAASTSTGDPTSAIQTRGKIQKASSAQQALFLGAGYETLSLLPVGECYAQKVLDEFHGRAYILFRTTATTQFGVNKPLVNDEDGVEVDVHEYQSMIGSFMYLTASRPDIIFAVYACARFQVTPKASHLHAVKRIFRYLKHQPKLGLWYPRDSPFELEAFSDNLLTKGFDVTRISMDLWMEWIEAVLANTTHLWSVNSGSLQVNSGRLLVNSVDLRLILVVDFLKGTSLRYALTHNPTIFDSLVKQFWQTATVRTLANGTQQLVASIDSKEYTITEASVRSKLQLADAIGIHNLSDAEIYAGLATLGTSLEGNTSGSVEDSMQLKELMVLVPTLVTRINSLEQELKDTKQTLGNAMLKLVKKRIWGGKKFGLLMMILSLLVRESMKEKSTDFVTPTKASGEAQEEEISPTILEAAKTLSKVASQGVSKEKEINIAKTRFLLAEKIINTGIEEVSTGSTKVDSGTTSKRGQREGKAPMIEEDIQATHKTKEQMRQEEAGLEEAIKLQAQLDEEVAKQIHLDKMIAKRMAEEEALTEQQKKRKAQVQFEAQFYTEED
ncbi:hypothetical protein Tco_0813833 [Tanacetum coccineum]